MEDGSGSPKKVSFSKLNDALLDSSCEQDEKEVKRNSKDDLIQKIVRCAEENEVRLQHSNTRLRRMTKQQLIELLAEVMEKSVRSQMAAQVGAKPNAADSVIALGALKMVHSIAANTAEKGLNIVLPRYGYQGEGFAENLKEPMVAEAVDSCLAEIASETDILQYIQSPYARLAIAWSGALVTSMKKTRRRLNNATRLGPRPPSSENSIQPRAGRGPQAGQVDSGFPPMPTYAKKV